MIRFVFSPRWFYGIDCLFEVASVIVSLLIAFASYRFYQFSKQPRYKYFAWSFLAIALAFVAKILTNINIYYSVLEHYRLGYFHITYTAIKVSEAFSIGGFLAYRFLTLLGFFGIFSLLQKTVDKRLLFLICYCFFVISIFSTFSFHVFHATLAFVLVLLCLEYLSLYRRQRKRQSLEIGIAMALILLSHVGSVFVETNLLMYVIAEVLQLLGFLVLLYSFYTIHTLKNVQKNKN